MPSTFSWVDNSERDRRRALDVIDLIRRQDTRDQLGIGRIRDALADLLAPGTSTIQTRARYFLFVPWIYQELERRGVSSTQIADKGRRRELRLAEILGDADDSVGAIGAEAGRGLVRLPSAVYWAGLGAYGIRLFSGSQEQYHRSVDRCYREDAGLRRQRGQGDEPPPAPGRWHPHIPEAPEGFPDRADFRLTEEEALFLQDRIRARAPGTAFALLVGGSAEVENASSWWADQLLEVYSDEVRAQIEDARCFSERMHGASLLYNLMLAEALPSDERVEHYEARLAGWCDVLEERAAEHAAWSAAKLWRWVDSAGRGGRSFVERWLALTETPSVELRTSGAARDLIRRREIRLKPGRARLAHREYLLMWGGAAGADPLEFRWSTARAVVGDIQAGLRGEGHARAA